VGGGKGHLHLDGLLVKKKIFDSCGLFLENLRLHQDTAMMIQLAETGLLIPGRIETPVAMRRVHAATAFPAGQGSRGNCGADDPHDALVGHSEGL
jgi:hypothetical protein